jgi:hypothetical protein
MSGDKSYRAGQNLGKPVNIRNQVIEYPLEIRPIH